MERIRRGAGPGSGWHRLAPSTPEPAHAPGVEPSADFSEMIRGRRLYPLRPEKNEVFADKVGPFLPCFLASYHRRVLTAPARWVWPACPGRGRSPLCSSLQGVAPCSEPGRVGGRRGGSPRGP